MAIARTRSPIRFTPTLAGSRPCTSRPERMRHCSMTAASWRISHQSRRGSQERDRCFESGSLQRRVQNELVPRGSDPWHINKSVPTKSAAMLYRVRCSLLLSTRTRTPSGRSISITPTRSAKVRPAPPGMPDPPPLALSSSHLMHRRRRRAEQTPPAARQWLTCRSQKMSSSTISEVVALGGLQYLERHMRAHGGSGRVLHH
jgi:hypothetical protein